ncbi:uncharacterized protein RHOBADRAFT_18175 [Rhodotorula graminis WP1]|uniref:Cation-transporting P-type ATPase N-terminal domain-containing protein n=1 Tax=Rhodotorula graminis (strain WP1) TaxID=578459 RepID=A0A0N8PZI2_RHOGW|nr:uncharacterized protein RHOBADRAFT_18175 [Rhodotorula graminis WP1]KPV72397.1 hypothetical protein RHOBADRAFT_18175 [Rhodotorula graminis WP1]
MPTLRVQAPASHGRALRRFDTIASQGSVRPRARIPVDFRTLSIQVTESRAVPKATGLPEKKNKDLDDLASLDWHTLSPDEVAQRLGVAPQAGLDNQVVARRLSSDGRNVITPARANWPRKIFLYFFGGFGSLLFVASVLCFVAWRPLGDPNPAVANLALAVVLLLVVILQAFFNALQDYKTTRTMSSIASVLPTAVLCRRDGATVELAAADLVKGDIVLLKMGVKVPADLRLIDVSPDCRFDRSILTGESVPVGATVEKTEDNFLETLNIGLQGTLCTDGTATGIVVGCGDSTVFGRIAKAAGRSRPLPSTLEEEVRHFVTIIASLAAAVVVLIIILWAAWLRVAHPGFITVPVLIIDCVSVAVAFIPEGLPFCVTMSLTVIANKMGKKGILAKSLTTVEALGAVSVLASDKTGTLTRNTMTAVSMTVGTSSFTAADARRISVDAANPTHMALNQVVAVAAICNDAEFVVCEDKDMPLEARKVVGDATDTGLLRFAESCSPVSSVRNAVVVKQKLAFNSKTKFAVKLCARAHASTAALPALFDGDECSDQVLLVKGAPDILMPRCASILRTDGSVETFTADAVAALVAVQSRYAALGQRVLLFAKRSILPEYTADLIGTEEDQLLSLVESLTVVGLVALVDPPKHDSEETVARCRAAGIRFFMVTGDFALTAAAIARQVGIITAPAESVKTVQQLSRTADDKEKASIVEGVNQAKTALVLSGPEMLTLSEEQWDQVLKFDEIVFARTSPQQKLQIVKRFQAAGETVAVTGDGVNDSAALKQADVGVAVAGGSEVAMEAADLVLLDDFSAIVAGVEAGRLCFQNLRKSILYLLPAGSFSELMPVLLNVFFGLPQALSSIQMIIICATTDPLPALSLTYEAPEADLLLRPPRDRKKDRLADWRLLLHAYSFLGLLESLTAMVGAFYFGFHRRGIAFSSLWLKYGGYDIDPDLLAEATSVAQSIYFFTLLGCQLGSLLATRTRRLSIVQQDPLFNPRTRNWRLFGAMACSLLIGFFFHFVPWFQRTFGTRGVPVEMVFLPVGYGGALLLLDEARKAVNRRWPKGVLACLAW